jgi:hypothetical protein
MAIVIRGKSKCVLCGNLLRDGDEVVSFSPFVSNELDPLWKFSDAGFHVNCFHQDALSEKAQQRYEELRNHVGLGNRTCVVCKTEITDPDDYFAVGHLTDDREHPLYRYNYVQAHRSCLPQWSELSQLSGLIEDVQKSGAWRGQALKTLLRELKEAARYD